MTRLGKFLLLTFILITAGAVVHFKIFQEKQPESNGYPPSLKVSSSIFKGSVQDLFYTFDGNHDERFLATKGRFQNANKANVTLRENLDYVSINNDTFEILGINPNAGISVKQILDCVSSDAEKLLFIQYKADKWHIYPKGPFGSQTVTIPNIDDYKVYPGEGFITFSEKPAEAYCIQKANKKTVNRVRHLLEGWNLVAIDDTDLNAFLAHYQGVTNVWYLNDIESDQPFKKFGGGNAHLRNFLAWIKLGIAEDVVAELVPVEVVPAEAPQNNQIPNEVAPVEEPVEVQPAEEPREVAVPVEEVEDIGPSPVPMAEFRQALGDTICGAKFLGFHDEEINFENQNFASVFFAQLRPQGANITAENFDPALIVRQLGGMGAVLDDDALKNKILECAPAVLERLKRQQ